MSSSTPSQRPSAPPMSPTLSATSNSTTTSTVATVIDSHPNPRSLINLRKQLKYLFIGLALTLYFQVFSHLKDALSLGLTSFSARLALLAAALLLGTVVIFTYVILLPARGYAVNYLEWNKDPHLQTTIPALTGCIIFGWLTLLFTLSPLGAPAPPAASIKQRLAQAAAYTGLDNLQSRINSIPSNYFGSSDGWDRISSFLSLGGSSTGDKLKEYFVQLSNRAETWGERNIMSIGWTGAVLGSVGCYLMVFGMVGLVGFVAPDGRKDKHKQL